MLNRAWSDVHDVTVPPGVRGVRAGNGEVMERPGVAGGSVRCLAAPGVVTSAGVIEDRWPGVAGGSIEADGEPCLGGVGVERVVIASGVERLVQ